MKDFEIEYVLAELKKKGINGISKDFIKFGSGHGNDVFLLKCNDVPKYVLRIGKKDDFPKYQTIGRLMVWLRRNKIPVPGLIASDIFNFPDGSVPYVLLEYVPGKNYDVNLDSEVHASVAKVIRAMHSLSVVEYKKLMGTSKIYVGQETWINYLQGLWKWGVKSLIENKVISDVDVKSQIDGNRCNVFFNKLFEKYGAIFRDAPVGLLHGDLHGENFVIKNDELKAVLDIDNAKPGDPAFDFVDFNQIYNPLLEPYLELVQKELPDFDAVAFRFRIKIYFPIKQIGIAGWLANQGKLTEAKQRLDESLDVLKELVK